MLVAALGQHKMNEETRAGWKTWQFTHHHPESKDWQRSLPELHAHEGLKAQFCHDLFQTGFLGDNPHLLQVDFGHRLYGVCSREDTYVMFLAALRLSEFRVLSTFNNVMLHPEPLFLHILIPDPHLPLIPQSYWKVTCRGFTLVRKCRLDYVHRSILGCS